jgi:hypothetical protein
MATLLLYHEKDFEIIKREEGADHLPPWEYDKFALLCEALIFDAEVRKIFLDFYLRENPPLLFSDPNLLFDEQTIIPKSGFFADETIILFKNNDLPDKIRFRELVKKLIEKKCIEKDKLSIIRCKNCGGLSIGQGDTSKKNSFFCTKCKTPALKKGTHSKRVVSVYSFSPEIKDLLFKSRGRILEGLIYYQCCRDEKIKERFQVIPYPQIRRKRINSEGKEIIEDSKERDILLIDREKKIKPIVVLASISSSQMGERKQVEECCELGLPVIFVCSRGVAERSTIIEKSNAVFPNVRVDRTFPGSLSEYIIQKLLPELEEA